ncbi:hypothetical protein V7S43_002261 [Phytophthora oleae]|uniref:Alpha-type protein kinase domain-containing protein n=1 Tax=Phytophthora oleae TaxID=2107226 RepID=A0ABD3G1E1_9STRA
MYDCNMEQYFVAKIYYGKAASVANAKSLKSDVEMQIVAKQLATEFSLSDKVENAVDFIFTCWYEIKNPIGAGLGPAMSLFTAEPYIKGEYKKYNNNNGWITKAYGQLMVVDLQGVVCIFTDPHIHSKQGEKFGCGNLSDAGMAAFFVTHECNEVCRALRLMLAKRLKSGSKAAPASEIVETKEESAKKAANKSMTCSCPLCGGITTVLHSDFIEAHRKGREIYCEACVVKKDKYETRVCCLCKMELSFSPYWYSMKGMEPPTSCKSCKAEAAKTKARKSKPRPRPVKS